MSGETSIILILLGIGLIFYLFPPPRINYFYGYRTRKSMKNKENWKFANQLAAKGLLLIMTINLALSLLFTEIFKLSSFEVLAVVLIVEFIGLFYFVERKLTEIG